MVTTVTQLVNEAYQLSSILAPDLETMSGSQLNAGIIMLNDLLAEQSITGKGIPYFSKYVFTATINTAAYHIPRLIECETFVFFIQAVRFQSVNQQRKLFRGSNRAENIQSLPLAYNVERELGGSLLTLYFTPDQAYPLEIWGKFALADVTVGTDLSTVYDRYYLMWLKFLLAQYICLQYNIDFSDEAESKLDSLTNQIMSLEEFDMSVQKVSQFNQDGVMNWGIVNLSGGYTTSGGGWG